MTTTPSQLAALRTRFEAWADDEGLSLKRFESNPDMYADRQTHLCWHAVQAAQPSLVELRDKLVIEQVAKAIHEAKMKICWGWMKGEHREPWEKPNAASPNQPWHDVAEAQADAVINIITGGFAPFVKGG